MIVFFYAKVYKTDKDSMNTKNKHRPNGYKSDYTKVDVVEAVAEVNKSKNRENIDEIIEDDVKDKIVFMDMPVEENDT